MVTREQLNDIRLCVESNLPCMACSCYEKHYGCTVPKMVNNEQKLIRQTEKVLTVND